MKTLDAMLSEVEARAKEMVDTRRHPSTVRMSNDALNLMLTLSEADVPKLVAALRLAVTKQESCCGSPLCVGYFKNDIAAILAGDGK